jgi:hypothetical protein
LPKPLFARNGQYLSISSISSRGIGIAKGRVNPTSGQGSNRGGPSNRQMIDGSTTNGKCLKACGTSPREFLEDRGLSAMTGILGRDG